MSAAVQLADISIGSTVFTKGIAFDADDLAVNASMRSQRDSLTGKGKHYGIVLAKSGTGLTLAGTATFGGATKLIGTVKPESVPFWIAVSPATKETDCAVVQRSSGDTGTPKWINIRNTHVVTGKEWKVLPEAYDEEVVVTLTVAIDVNIAASRSASNSQ